MYQYVAVATLIGLGFSTGVHVGQRHGLKHHETVLHATDELINMLKTNIVQLETANKILINKVEEIKTVLSAELSEHERLQTRLHTAVEAKTHAETYAENASKAFIELKNRLAGIELPTELASDLDSFIKELLETNATLPKGKSALARAGSAVSSIFRKEK